MYIYTHTYCSHSSSDNEDDSLIPLPWRQAEGQGGGHGEEQNELGIVQIRCGGKDLANWCLLVFFSFKYNKVMIVIMISVFIMMITEVSSGCRVL